MGVKVHDKVDRMAEHLGICKAWVAPLLDISTTTLSKWSYNPGNVSTEMDQRIRTRLAILDGLGIRIRKDPEMGKEHQSYWVVSIEDDVYYILDYRRRLVMEPPRSVIRIIRNSIIREEIQHPMYVRNRFLRREGPLTKIAKDKSLEMPFGLHRWDEGYLTKEEP